MTQAQGSFAVTAWQEDAYEEFDGGAKLTRAVVGQSFMGDIVGEGAVQWLMSYRDDGTARFVGLQRIAGTLDGHAGSFVLETSGDFDGKVVVGTWSVVTGSGSAELTGLRGTGTFNAPLGPEATFALEYELD